jgi:hypothetical protein
MANHHILGGFHVRTPPHHICGVTSTLMFSMMMFLLLLVHFHSKAKRLWMNPSKMLQELLSPINVMWV